MLSRLGGRFFKQLSTTLPTSHLPFRSIATPLAMGKKTKASSASPDAATAAAAAAGDGNAAAAGAAGEAPTPKRARRAASATASPSPKAAAASPAPTRRSPRLPTPKKLSPADKAAAAATTTSKPAAAPKRAAAAAKPPPGPIYSQALRPSPLADPELVVASWNVAGLRSLLKKDAQALRKLVDRERVDVLCLQETKLQEGHVAGITEELGLAGWSAAWSCSTVKKGYSGVAVLSRAAPLSTTIGLGAAAHDGEGRVVTVELPGLFVVNAYVPNSGEGLKRLDYRVGEWDVAFSDYVRSLEARGKPVVVAGDLNCAHKEIDIHSPKTNLKSAGFTPEERASFGERLVAPGGPLVDAFRAQHPEVVAYTYYSYRFNARAKGKGWRLDYCLVSKALAPRVHDAWILPEVEGSDHVPLGVVIRKA